MKVKNTNELWLLNLTQMDVSISDLGVKVPAGKTINVFKVNPYLTKSKVDESMSNGALLRRIEAKILSVVSGKQENKTIKNIKESEETTIKAVKTRSSVVIEQECDDIETDDGFDFADYGINDIGERQLQSDGAITIAPKEDPVDDDEKEKTVVTPVVESNISQQSQVVMKTHNEAVSDSFGKMAGSSVPTKDRPFIVSKPPETEEDENLEEEDVEEEFDSKVATITEDGAIIMKLKEKVSEDD